MKHISFFYLLFKWCEFFPRPRGDVEGSRVVVRVSRSTTFFLKGVFSARLHESSMHTSLTSAKNE